MVAADFNVEITGQVGWPVVSSRVNGYHYGVKFIACRTLSKSIGDFTQTPRREMIPTQIWPTIGLGRSGFVLKNIAGRINLVTQKAEGRSPPHPGLHDWRRTYSTGRKFRAAARSPIFRPYAVPSSVALRKWNPTRMRE